jgi:tRNA A-37 threonylcarbamoyl transferase component Bud32
MFTLIRVHDLGIEHGDFAERNVMQGRQYSVTRLLVPRHVLIDFSHARTSHRCTGTDCRELLDASEQLGLTSDDLSCGFHSRRVTLGALLIGTSWVVRHLRHWLSSVIG